MQCRPTPITCCLWAAFCFLLFATMPAAAEQTAVTWTFTKTEMTAEGIFRAYGTLRNGSDKVLTRLDKYVPQFTRDGAERWQKDKKPYTLPTPLQPGKTMSFFFSISNAKGVVLDNFRISFEEVTLVAPTAKPATKPAVKPTAKPAAHFKGLKVVYDKKRGCWLLTGQIVNNSQTHKVVRQDYRKVTYTTGGRQYSDVNNETVPVTVPPMGVLAWSIPLVNAKSEFRTTSYDTYSNPPKDIRTDLRFSMMPADSPKNESGTTIIIK